MSGHQPSSAVMKRFQAIVWEYYRANGRDLPWRNQPTLYAVYVSEVMLQQTQVSRVLPKYEQFIYSFPDFNALAKASQKELLTVWKGLGYNRRALWLKAAAEKIIRHHHGVLPASIEELAGLPGIGPNTAAAIVAYVYNQPVVFIETNIRRVFLYHFFPEAELVHDKQLIPLITVALKGQDPRHWYWALMDYGTHLARSTPNPNRRSRHYTRQSRFEGSHRQLRGKILELLLQGPQQLTDVETALSMYATSDIRRAVDELTREGFLSQASEGITIIDT